ncbi:MAG: hypothetical protein IT326_02650 [Anaerolineae bacterium]|nr:hypothetical protein [Anaerolineae bacterium]
MRGTIIRIVSVAVALLLIAAGLRLGWSAYRRAATPFALLRGAYEIREGGIILETLTARREGGPLPFPVTAYVIRYTFPNPPGGQMRNGEQTVTRRFFNRAGTTGTPIVVYVQVADTRINAVDPRIVFPAESGWLLGGAFGSFTLALVVLNGGWALAASLMRRKPS